jgi:hypothetical protein
MKRAMSLVDNADLDALEFSRMDEQWRSARRRRLACIACGAPAFFRAASARRSAAFGAVHDDQCVLTAPPWTAFRFLQ